MSDLYLITLRFMSTVQLCDGPQYVAANQNESQSCYKFDLKQQNDATWF